MEIRVKLMGLLKQHTPPEGRFDVSERATIDDVLTALQIVPDRVQVFTVNGTLVRDRSYQLSSGDELMVLPPVGGG